MFEKAVGDLCNLCDFYDQLFYFIFIFSIYLFRKKLLILFNEGIITF